MLPKPKKSLGQNFLSDPAILGRIVDACELSLDETVLEIGPGRGALTGLLAGRCAKVYAVELDSRLCAGLKQAFAGQPNVEIIHADILKFDLAGLACRGRLVVVGNIPYYITTPIIERLFTCGRRIERAYLTVQKEFGQRMVAGPGSKQYGSFSLFVQYYCQPQIRFTIKAGSFHPVPKVDSCLLGLAMRSQPAVQVADQALLFKVIRSAFGQRRKQLRNSLKHTVDPAQLQAFLQDSGLKQSARAEELSLEQFANLTNRLN